MPKHLLYLLFFIVSVLLSRDAICEELFSHKEIQVSIDDGYSCQADVSVRLDVDSEEQIRKSRIDMQALSDMVKTYLWIDCDKIESISYFGYIKGKENIAYQAIAKKDERWFLNEQEVKSKTPKAPEEKKPATTNLPPPRLKPDAPGKVKQQPTQKTLEEECRNGSISAMLELAKGLLGLSRAAPNVKFQEDAEKGKKILEELASQGNHDAKHLLGEAYQSNAKLEVNLKLLNKITNTLPKEPANQRGQVAAQLTVEAASKGSKEAISALNQAGKAGSDLAYYAIGVMYLLDEQKEMPVDSEFIEKELQLELDNPGNGGFGNTDIGLRFLILAAENGNTDAQCVLEDLDVKFSSSGQTDDKNESAHSANNGEPNQQAQNSTASKQSTAASNSSTTTASSNSAQKTSNTSGTQANSASHTAATLAKSIQSLNGATLDEMVNSSRMASAAKPAGASASKSVTQQQGASSSHSGTQSGASGKQKGEFYGSSQDIPANTKQGVESSTGKQNTENKPIEILD